MISVIELRKKEEIKKLPDVPGVYKFWGDEEILRKISEKLGVNFEDVKKVVEFEEGVYCIYIGIAVNESIKSRINWHINRKHSDSAVKAGTLSTLKQSLAAIFIEDMSAEHSDELNNIIDKLYVSICHKSLNVVKSDNANTEIHGIEKSILSGNNLYILNIQENRNELAPTAKLKELRKAARNNCI